MKITGLGKTIKGLKSAIVFQSKSLFAEIGEYIKTRIKLRTSAGKDFEGSPFKSYSERYKLFRAKGGYPTTTVDLFYSGSMMGSMTAVSKPTSVRIFFSAGTDENGVSNSGKAYWLNKDRNFFAYSQADLKQVINMYVKRVKSK